jgi:uncharacterized integral membrane protein
MSGDLDSAYPSYPSYGDPETTDADGGPSSSPERKGGGSGFLIGALVAAAAVTFAFQNTQRIDLRFLWFEGSLPLWVAMALAVLGTAVVLVTLIGGSARKRRRQRRRAAARVAAGT